ncbi:MAG: sodium ion-translocating decarboxylase subunit beta [Firmicutes bacterium]|nr:sodium ion-translocating decarboxylase subunit beta [Bacillota bacterium]
MLNNIFMTSLFRSAVIKNSDMGYRRTHSMTILKAKKRGVFAFVLLICVVLSVGLLVACNSKSIGLIGGSDGPTSVFVSIGKGKQAGNLPEDKIKHVIEGFGNALKSVSLTAPKDIAAESIKKHYSPYVTKELLAEWMENPEKAPGRTVSSPWPDRIEITDIVPVSKAEYTVTGEIVEITSVELNQGGAAARYPISLKVVKHDNQWLIFSINLKDEGTLK